MTATVTGTGEVTSLTIDPERRSTPSDVEALADLVVAAMRDANRAGARRCSRRRWVRSAGPGGRRPAGLPGL